MSSESGFYYSVSTDLIHWSEGRLFLCTPDALVRGLRSGPLYIIRRSSTLAVEELDVIGDDPYLYFVRQHLDGCQRTMRRDPLRIRLRLAGR